MRSGSIIISGSDQRTNIPANAMVTITGGGYVEIDGEIGENATIVKQGAGVLVINAIIATSAKFMFYGGEVTFLKRPPTKVQRSMIKEDTKIIMHRELSMSGSDTLHDIGNNVTVTVTGNGSTMITGKIGENALIIKQGLGALEVNTKTIDDSARFILESGKTLFTHKPSDIVWETIVKKGNAKLEILDPHRVDFDRMEYEEADFELKWPTTRPYEVAFAKPSSTNTVFTSLQAASAPELHLLPKAVPQPKVEPKIMENKPAIPAAIADKPVFLPLPKVLPPLPKIEPKAPVNNKANYEQKLPEAVPAPKQVSEGVPKAIPVSDYQTLLEKFKRDCDDSLRSFINNIELGKTQTIAARIKALKLTDEEEEDFEMFEDPITNEYVKIPVLLDGRSYDLSQVVKMQGTDSESRKTFKPEQIQVGRPLLNMLDSTIAKLTKHREKQKKDKEKLAPAAEGPPGGMKLV